MVEADISMENKNKKTSSNRRIRVENEIGSYRPEIWEKQPKINF